MVRTEYQLKRADIELVFNIKLEAKCAFNPAHETLDMNCKSTGIDLYPFYYHNITHQDSSGRGSFLELQ